VNKKPLIGITATQEKGDSPASYQIGRHYVKGIAAVGGTPVILPLLQDKEQIKEMAKRLDGLLISGGVDMDPLIFGEEPHPKMGRIDPERDFFEKNILENFLEEDKAVFGICRGCQIINLVLGGTIYQDITSQMDSELIKHSQNAPRWYPTHSIEVEKGSKLSKVLGDGKIKVNSFHHQAIKEGAPGFFVSARAADGVVEAIESKNGQFLVGVQWHPEHLWERDQKTLALFRMFIDHSRR